MEEKGFITVVAVDPRAVGLLRVWVAVEYELSTRMVEANALMADAREHYFDHLRDYHFFRVTALSETEAVAKTEELFLDKVEIVARQPCV